MLESVMARDGGDLYHPLDDSGPAHPGLGLYFQVFAAYTEALRRYFGNDAETLPSSSSQTLPLMGTLMASCVFPVTISQDREKWGRPRDLFGRTILQVALYHISGPRVEPGDVGIFDTEAKDIFGLTTLHLCAIENNIQCAKLLLGLCTAYTSLETRDMHGRTPLHYAAALGHIELVGLLLAR